MAARIKRSTTVRKTACVNGKTAVEFRIASRRMMIPRISGRMERMNFRLEQREDNSDNEKYNSENQVCLESGFSILSAQIRQQPDYTI